ncbi:MAG: tetratricopeptide repeat protein [gamma proteobacterium symbiont of Clathrolucina costata]|uniref:Tetratricopeptide repeat protein n=1 Tax=Candidatus Thiodiazotropha taylori TaxID=2792791 RepID=A0A9E4NPG3_9GAMM|nr:tetratricopeptide repeat protein [Candidatus Thiodiazotropha taylori]MCW4239192.1 tetratricopeptide repeat protein [Candidatus Thiodiazotropha endolucinida]
MENEALHVLKEIRGILYFIAAMLGVITFMWFANWVKRIIIEFRTAWESAFINKANKYFERAQYEKLASHCEDMLKENPNHSNAIWWLARAKMGAGELHQARALFERLSGLEPQWQEEQITPYLEQMSGEEAGANK